MRSSPDTVSRKGDAYLPPWCGDVEHSNVSSPDEVALTIALDRVSSNSWTPTVESRRCLFQLVTPVYLGHEWLSTDWLFSRDVD